jgi:hypothetical protein
MSGVKAALACAVTAVALLTAGIAGGHLWAEPNPVEACNALSHSVADDGLQSEANVCLGELFDQR